jgi:hypothetical protein
MVMVHPADGWW